MPAVGKIIVSKKTAKNMKPRDKTDHYRTPEQFLDKFIPYAISLGLIKDSMNFFDVGVGTGVWGEMLVEHLKNIGLYGIEIDQERFPKHYLYDGILFGDFLKVGVGEYKPDILIGNPPYLKRKINDLLAMAFSVKVPVLFLLKTEIRHSIRRYERFYSKGLAPQVTIELMERPNFESDEQNRAYPGDYSIFYWNPNVYNLTSQALYFSWKD